MLHCLYREFYSARCYGAFSAKALKHGCSIKLQQGLEDTIEQAFAHHHEIANHSTGDIILPPHVTHYPFDMKALTNAQVGPLIPLPLSRGVGITGLVRRLRSHEIQRQDLLDRGQDEVDGRSNELKYTLFQFNFSCLRKQINTREFFMYLIGTVV